MRLQLLEKHENTKTKPQVMVNQHLMTTVTWHQTEQVHQKNIWKYGLYLCNMCNLWIRAEMQTVNFPLSLLLLLLFCEIIKVTHYTHSHFWSLSMNCFWFRPRAKERSLFSFPFMMASVIFPAPTSYLMQRWGCTRVSNQRGAVQRGGEEKCCKQGRAWADVRKNIWSLG